ncbi:MAG: hypothetical protein ACRC5M_00390, partial [Anaeroplasmataceae bacterium]
HKLGENDIKNAIIDANKLLKLAVSVGFCITLIAFSLSFLMPVFYPSVDEQTLAMSKYFLLIAGLFFPNFMVAATSFFILRSGADTRGVLIMDAGFMWVVCIPSALMLTYFTDLPIVLVYLIVQTIDLIKTYIGLRRVKKQKWAVNLVH